MKRPRAKTNTQSHFRRYTNLAATIHLLRSRQITLLNPATWEDKNDAYFMSEYKRHKNAKAVLALCFAERSETFHHWRVFSHGSDGVCIEFDKHSLLSTFKNDQRVKHGTIDYKLLDEIRGIKTVDTDDLPFMKRHPFKDECEFRVVYTDMKEAPAFKNFSIDLDWVKRITLGPWMSDGLADSVKETLRSIDGCKAVKIARTTLIENETWKGLTTKVRNSLAAVAKRGK